MTTRWQHTTEYGWHRTAGRSTTPPSPQRVAAERGRVLLGGRRAPDAPALQVVTVAPGVTALRTSPIPVATPPADLAERLEEFDESMQLERELAALGGAR